MARIGSCLIQVSPITPFLFPPGCVEVWKIGKRVSVLELGIVILESSFQNLLVLCPEPHGIANIHVGLIGENDNFTWFSLTPELLSFGFLA